MRGVSHEEGFIGDSRLTCGANDDGQYIRRGTDGFFGL